jgi:hypothetical protein
MNGALMPSGAKALIRTREVIAALKRCATQNLRPPTKLSLSANLFQKMGGWAILQDHIRNEVAVRSMPGSVVL